MARAARHAPLNVFINGRHVGLLRKEPSGAIDFAYDRTWLDWAPAMPVSLSLPLREDRYVGAPVVAVFDNLLPDNAAIRRRIAVRVRAEGTDAFSLLGAIGRDCVGALQFLPVDEAPDPAGGLDATPLTEADVAAMLSDLDRAPLGLTEDAAFRISLAGAQEKTALLLRDGRWWAPTGITPTTHILKPAIGILPDGLDLSDSVENEFLCMRLTAAFGLATARVEMADFGGRRVLVVERFDRRWTRDGRLLRLPQEDMCQALSTPPAIKYEADGGPGIARIARLLAGGDDAAADQGALLKASVVFWLLGATDGHAKNFSLFLRPGGRFRMTPLYDVLSAQPAVDAGQLRRNRFRLAMAVGGRRHYTIDSIAPRHFVQTALGVGIGASIVEGILGELADTVPRALDDTLSRLPEGFPAGLAASVRDAVRTRLDLVESHLKSGGGAPEARRGRERGTP
jgi:serine/threonine-protein kinase HipA